MASNETKTTNFISGWNEPLCLIGNFTDDKLEVDKKTLSMLQEITEPVVVVSIVGLYRTGKSYLLNRLAGRAHGFALGSTVQSKTKGIWVWCVRHSKKPNCVLMFLDTEGLGDVAKGDSNHDAWIFSLAVLLSSTLIYNSIGTIGQGALNDLYFITEMAERIKIKSKGDDDESVEFDKFFPSFVWTVRDFTLDLAIDGNDVTEDAYLEHALRLKLGAGKKVSEYNLPRECIRAYFPQRKCFTFPMPVDDKNQLRELESVSDSKIKPEFLEQTRKFVDHIVETGRMKTINGRHVTGRILGGVANSYVDAIRNGAVPCIESAVEATAKVENERAIIEAVELYQSKFKSRLTFPTETVLDVSNCHHHCEREAADCFLTLAIFDSEKIFYQRMMEELNVAYQNFVAGNEAASREKCASILGSLHQPVEEAFKEGKFACPGGYEQYRADMDTLVQNYRQAPGKGVMSEEVLCKFMKQQEPTSASVLKADEKITEEEKKVEEEREKAKAMEREKLAAEEKVRKNERLMEDENKSYEEHIRRLDKQADEDRQRIKEEYEKVLEKMFKEQDLLFKEGFKQRANDMNHEIYGLRKAVEEQQQKSREEGILDFFGKIITSGAAWVSRVRRGKASITPSTYGEIAVPFKSAEQNPLQPSLGVSNKVPTGQNLPAEAINVPRDDDFNYETPV